MIALVDYGLGNLQAFDFIYRRLGIDAFPARTPADIRAASRIILPGVGAFDWAMMRLQKSGLRDALDEEVLQANKPVLGVCVGMQMMARSSEEGKLPGLGWIDAEVVRLDTSLLATKTHLPHMGWNIATPTARDSLFVGSGSPAFYFLHSYIVTTDRKQDVLSSSVYGAEFTSAIRCRNVYGTQFHPEKSHGWGVQLLKNFAEIK